MRLASTGAASESRDLARQTSVVIVAYNSGRFLRECVASIRSTQPTVQVVVVDNASTDGAVESAKAEFPAIQVVRSERNTGFGSGGNLGATHAKGAFLVFLNPDAVVTDGWLEALVRPLAVDSSVGLVTPKVLLQNDPDRINVAGLDVHLSGISVCRGLGLSRSDLDEEVQVAAVSGVACAIRRDAFEVLCGFDEDFFLYMEDVDISLRAWLGGYHCLYVPSGTVLHNYALKVDARKTFYVERGRYLMLLKAFSWRTLLGLLPTLALAEIITWGWLLWRNPRAVVQKLRAYCWVLAHWARIMEKRRQVQARRARSDSVFLARCEWHLNFDQLAGPQMARAAGAVLGPLLRGSSHVVQLALGRRGEGLA